MFLMSVSCSRVLYICLVVFIGDVFFRIIKLLFVTYGVIVLVVELI